MGAPGGVPLPAGTVTLVFTDIEGSTRLLHEIGPAYERVLADHHRVLRGEWTGHGGVEVDTEGDAFFVAFASPSEALQAAASAQRRLAEHEWPEGHRVRVRMGLHTGEPKQMDGTYWGIDVHYAARLCSAAHGDQVLISAATRALVPDAAVDDLGEHALKDFPVARHIFHLVVGGRRAAEFAPPRTLESTRTNLPSITAPLLGRDEEIADLSFRLRAGGERLVTITGAGGTGKTRVAIGCGAVLLDSFADGVFLVGLAPVSDATGVAAAAADALAAPRAAELGAEAGVLEFLADKDLLVILDNFEHVLDACAFVGRLLDASPGLHVLVTSQTPLRLAAETILPLEPLAVPGNGPSDVEALAATGAVALFVERARAADPSFRLTAQNAAAVAELCRQLDGLPLALELAAARVRMAGVDGLLTALARGADALGRGRRDMPERQRGLRAALEWTVGLLDDEQRELFAGLALFADAWTIDQAEQIFGLELDLWEAMAALIDFSLIRTRGDGRLTMAQRVREHAEELLSASGREHELRTRHAELMAEYGEHLSDELILDLNATIARTREALEEFDQGLGWARRADDALYRRLLGAVGFLFYFAGRLPTIIEDIAARAELERGHDVTSGRLMVAQSAVETLAGDARLGCSWTEPAVECHRRTAGVETLVMTMCLHAHMLTLANRGPDARVCVAEALALAAGTPDHRVRDQLEGTLAFAAVVEENFGEAEERLHVMIAAPERTDFAARAATSYMGDCALGQRKGELALEWYAKSLRALRGVDVNNMVIQIAGIAAALAVLGRDEEATEVFGAARRAAHDLGIEVKALILMGPAGEPLRELEARLPAEAWRRHLERGRLLDLEQATDFSLSLADARVATR